LNSDDILLTGAEFVSALYKTIVGKHYPKLTILADDPVELGRRGGIRYEGANVTSRVINFEGDKPGLVLQLASPESAMLKLENIRNFSLLDGKVYWNSEHPLVVSHHGFTLPVSQDPPLPWIVDSVKEMKIRYPEFVIAKFDPFEL
jgi:hypothetical protein